MSLFTGVLMVWQLRLAYHSMKKNGRIFVHLRIISTFHVEKGMPA